MARPVYILGDVHGKFDELMRIVKDNDIKDCYIICVGDLGIGFHDNRLKEIRAVNFYNQFFKARNIYFMSIRGNHDDPSYFFNKRGKMEHSNFELLDDYTTRTLNGEKYLFVGGAISIDRRIRVFGKSYWEDETFNLVPEKIVDCDVLITHSVPSWNGNFSKSGINSWCEKDATLWDECLKEREGHDELIMLSKPTKHYAGHMHISLSTTLNGCTSRIVDELEIITHHQ